MKFQLVQATHTGCPYGRQDDPFSKIQNISKEDVNYSYLSSSSSSVVVESPEVISSIFSSMIFVERPSKFLTTGIL